MKNALAAATAIRRAVAKKDCVILLDFDGTLVPLQRDFDAPRLSRRTTRLLRNLAEKYPLAIVSGRALADVKKRVPLHGLSYGGCHGMEWHIGVRRGEVTVPTAARENFLALRLSLAKIAKKHGAKIEQKRLSCALHYRTLRLSTRSALLKEAQEAIRMVGEGTVRVLHEEKAFDVMPQAGATKGTCARMLFNALRRSRKAVPLYIGDGTTDEDAFRMLKRGITIRVGKKTGSAAHYFVARRSDVDSFLFRLAQ